MIQEKLGRLIVVDDEVETLTPLCDLLSEWGYEVAGYASCNEALEALKKQDFDMLLTDLVMPEMDGIELIKAATKIDPILICIIITGKGTIQTAVEAMKLGAFDYVLKPIEWKTFKPILSRAMDVHRLRKSEEKYRVIIEDLTELICRFLPDGTLTFVNEAYCRYFGMKSKELIGKSFMPFIPEEDREMVYRQFKSLGLKNSVVTYEHRVILPNGDIRWHQWTDRAIFDGQEQVIEFQSVGRDITKRKLAEEALKESEEKFRELADSVTDVFFAMDKDLKYIYWNKASENLTGIPEKDVIGKSLYEIFPDTLETRRAGNIYLDVFRTQQPQNFINRYQIKNKEHYFEINAYPSKKGLSVFVTDITERKQVEEELKQSEKRLRSLADAAFEGIVFHKEGIILRNNEQFSEMCGYGPDELLGENIISLLVAPEAKEFVVEQITGGREGPYEAIGVRKNGTKFSMEIRAREAELEGQKIRVATVMDITERKQGEEQLRKSHRLLRNLAASLSEAEERERKRLAQELHDQVGQTLSALGINLNLIRSQISKKSLKIADHRIEDSLELLKKTTESMRTVMSDLRPSVLDDYGLLAGIRWYSEKFSGRTNITVEIHGEELKPRLPMSVETTMFRIYQEALTNIAKHSHAKKTIISLKETYDGVKLSIADDGIGFDSETVYKTKKEMVWGLHTMKERAEALGGKFIIESKPGTGTKIIVEIHE
jgi:PAS domain S-box-containing protein